MKKCKNCNQELSKELNLCPSCGAEQSANMESWLILLCVLTIIGSVFTIGRALLYELVSSMSHGSDYSRGWTYAGSAIGTIIGAILMLKKKLIGLYTYSFFQIIYIITVIIATFSHSNTSGATSDWVFGISMLFLIPSIIFLILYWTKMIRKHLA
jgi:hypothetical protein